MWFKKKKVLGEFLQQRDKYLLVNNELWKKLSEPENEEDFYIETYICRLFYNAFNDNAPYKIKNKYNIYNKNHFLITAFYSDDNSFGSFLEDNWTSLGGQEEMTTVSSNATISTTGATTTTCASTTGGYTTTTYTIPSDWGWSNISTSGTVILSEDGCRKIVREEINKEKEMNDSKNIFNFDFGPVNNNEFRMSPYGIAVHTDKGGWIAYDVKENEIIDVNTLNFDASKFIYKIPVARKDIKIGDILIHNGRPVFVNQYDSEKTGKNLTVIDYTTASIMTILPIKSPFGFDFFTKVCALVDTSGLTATAETPFGNMLPFLMLNGNDKDIDFLPLFLMDNKEMDFTKNPMMMYALMNQKSDKNNLLPFLMMMSKK